MDPCELFEREFLPIRAKILEIGAALDRIQRAGLSSEDEPRMRLIEQGLEALDGSMPDRAEQIQLIFSRPYSDTWQDEFELSR